MTWKSDTGTKIEHCPIRYRKPVSTKFGTIVMVNKEFQIACQTLQKPVPVFCTDFWYIYIHTRCTIHIYNVSPKLGSHNLEYLVYVAMKFSK